VTTNAHTVVIDWGDGSADSTLSLGAGVTGFNGTHTYLDEGANAGQDTVTATVNDGSTSASGTAAITVNNVAPSNVNGSLSSTIIDEGSTVTATGTFTDPGTQDLHTAVVDWGDGSTATTLSLAAGVSTFSATH